MAVELEVGVRRRDAICQHQVQPVQGQFGQQGLEVIFQAMQSQRRLVDHGLHQVPHRELGQAIRDAEGQAHLRGADAGAHQLRQLLAEREDLVGLAQGRAARVGQHQAATGRLQQGVAQLPFEFPDLGADGLDGHVQPGRGARHAALLGHHPEIVEVPVAEVQAHVQCFNEVSLIDYMLYSSL